MDNQMTLVRLLSVGGATIGMLMFSGSAFVTLENGWHNNQKIISCIPDGKYKVEVTHNRTTFGGMLIPLTYEVKGVPNRSGILFHIGNYESDTSGCILLGQYWLTVNGHKPMVCQSRIAFNKFTDLIKKQKETEFLKVITIT